MLQDHLKYLSRNVFLDPEWRSRNCWFREAKTAGAANQWFIKQSCQPVLLVTSSRQECYSSQLRNQNSGSVSTRVARKNKDWAEKKNQEASEKSQADYWTQNEVWDIQRQSKAEKLFR